VRFHQLHPGIAINAGMKGCGFRMSGPTREWQTGPRGCGSEQAPYVPRFKGIMSWLALFTVSIGMPAFPGVR
jgi:hypothetical protein